MQKKNGLIASILVIVLIICAAAMFLGNRIVEGLGLTVLGCIIAAFNQETSKMAFRLETIRPKTARYFTIIVGIFIILVALGEMFGLPSGR